MLQECLHHYGIPPYSLIYRVLSSLQQDLFRIHSSGYEQGSSFHYEFLFNSELNFYGLTMAEQVIEVCRYASLFGLINNLYIEPNKISWTSNPYHQRDLFFSKFRFESRELKKISPIF